jgi:hypothetical protein
MDDSALFNAFQLQARACQALGSEASAAILMRAADGVDGPLRDLLAPWEAATVRQVVTDAVPLRFLGALHELVLDGEAADLDGAWALVPRQADRIAAFMGHEPQTNEVRRSACLLGGFLTVAAETGLPMRLFELGASAGLNQLWDRYRYDLGAAGEWGDPASPVRLDTEWRGPAPPLGAPVRVASRAACDRKPVDINDADACRRLRAYIWIDQPERRARLDAAIEMARAAGTRVEGADAADWTALRVAPLAGAATVLFHSVFWGYMPAESQAALEATIAELGARATADAPFAWLRMEPPPTNLARMEVRLTLWPGGEDRLLATCHAQGAWVAWVG